MPRMVPHVEDELVDLAAELRAVTRRIDENPRALSPRLLAERERLERELGVRAASLLDGVFYELRRLRKENEKLCQKIERSPGNLLAFEPWNER
jgi:capsule polysaccharide export protein KpsE/RkpR